MEKNPYDLWHEPDPFPRPTPGAGLERPTPQSPLGLIAGWLVMAIFTVGLGVFLAITSWLVGWP